MEYTAADTWHSLVRTNQIIVSSYFQIIDSANFLSSDKSFSLQPPQHLHHLNPFDPLDLIGGQQVLTGIH